MAIKAEADSIKADVTDEMSTDVSAAAAAAEAPAEAAECKENSAGTKVLAVMVQKYLLYWY